MSTLPCACEEALHSPKLVVVTGGPGAGKTALLEMVKKHFCEHVAVLPESAGIVFGGGFPRHPTAPGQRASQRAIFRVQVELETMALEEQTAAVALCDRGTLDGLAYWPDSPAAFWEAVGATAEAQWARYAAVVHLQTPPLAQGYNHDNPLRIESAEEAARIDARIAEAWAGHPKRVVIPSSGEFLEKVARALEAIRQELPECCRAHRIPGVEVRRGAGGVP